MNKENLEEHAQQQIEDAARDDEGLEEDKIPELLEILGSEDYPNGDMAEPYDLRGDR